MNRPVEFTETRKVHGMMVTERSTGRLLEFSVSDGKPCALIERQDGSVLVAPVGAIRFVDPKYCGAEEKSLVNVGAIREAVRRKTVGLSELNGSEVACPACRARWPFDCEQARAIELFGECFSCRFLPGGPGTGEGSEEDMELIRNL